MKQVRRRGFSLLEVLLATTVLLGSVIVLSHISFVGTAHMDAARQYSAAQLVCQARMNEMLAGALPIEEVSGQAIPELPGWGLTVKVKSANQPGLLAIEVTAAERPAEATVGGSAEGTAETAAAPQQAAGTGKQFTLVRWIAESEGLKATNFLSASEVSVPVEVPEERSFFDDSLPPGDLLLPEEPPLPFGPPLPEGPGMFDEPLPEEPSMFEEPMPEL
jgi:type II secretory pathway pseudopilin PulG